MIYKMMFLWFKIYVLKVLKVIFLNQVLINNKIERVENAKKMALTFFLYILI